jgi:hypothetical protein
MNDSKEDYELWFEHIKEQKEKELKEKELENYINKIEGYITGRFGNATDHTDYKWDWQKDYHEWVKDKLDWRKSIDDKTEPDKRPPLIYPEVNDGQFIGQLFLDEETGELVLKMKDGKKIIIESLEDFKKIKTKFLLKR